MRVFINIDVIVYTIYYRNVNKSFNFDNIKFTLNP